MKKTPTLLWIAALALGWLFDYLFWGQGFGLNFVLFLAVCLVSGFLLLRANGLRPARRAVWLLPLIIFFLGSTFMRAEPMTVFLSILLTLFLLGVLANTFLGGRWTAYGMSDYFSGFFNLIGSMIARPLIFNAEVKRDQSERGTLPRKIDPWPAVRGFLIALPILAIFAALLASADEIFLLQLSDFLDRFLNLNIVPEYLFRLIYILIIAYLLAGAYLHAARPSGDTKLQTEKSPAFSQILGFTETAIVLGSVNILFASFVAVQFQYFFGGHAYIGAGGLTDSEYARRGFGELAVVAFLSLLLILGLSTITRRVNAAQRRAYSGLSVTLVALVLVILVSAYQRLSLNELAHGFFRLRTYSHVFYFWLALLLVTVVVLEILQRERAFALAAVMAALGFAASLSLL